MLQSPHSNGAGVAPRLISLVVMCQSDPVFDQHPRRQTCASADYGALEGRLAAPGCLGLLERQSIVPKRDFLAGDPRRSVQSTAASIAF